MFKFRLITFIILLVAITLNANKYYFSEKDIRSIPARNLYDILVKITALHGLSLGETGQPVFISATGPISNKVTLYLDEIFYGIFSQYDLSFIRIEQISSIEIDDSYIQNNSLIIKITTLKKGTEGDVSKVVYKDAFNNYRDLEVDLSEDFSEKLSFSLNGGVMDFKDIRDDSDEYSYSYEKYSLGLKLFYPLTDDHKTVADISYIKENKYELLTDSSKVNPLSLRSAISIISDFDQNFNNTFSLIHIYKENSISENHFSFHDLFNYSSGKNKLMFDMILNTERRVKENIFSSSIQGKYSRTSFINYSVLSAFSTNDESELLSAGFIFNKSFGEGLIIENNSVITESITDISKPDLFKNSFLIKFLTGNNIRTGISAGYDLVHYQKHDIKNDYIKTDLSLDIFNRISIKSGLMKKISSYHCLNEPELKLTVSILYSDKFFNDKLNLLMSVHHNYSELYIADNDLEIINNLSLNFSAKILNFEFFFGSDNFLKDKYSVGNVTIHTNDHYRYSTITGFEMPLKDEIWGVRWVFTN